MGTKTAKIHEVPVTHKVPIFMVRTLEKLAKRARMKKGRIWKIALREYLLRAAEVTDTERDQLLGSVLD